MDVDFHFSSKKYKTVSTGKDIVVLDLEEFDNRIEKGGKEGCLIQEEISQHNEYCDASSTEQTISQFDFQSQPSLGILNLQSYSYTNVNASQFRSKNELLKKYFQKRFQVVEENQRLLNEVRSISLDKISLLIVKDPTRNVLNFALTEEEKVTEVKIQMDKVNIPDKILFHKKTNEMLYYDLMHMSLNKNKLENKVERLEKKLKKEKAMRRAWQTQVKSYENKLIVAGIQPKEKQSIKKLLDEKEKVIKSLKKQLKILVTDHPQIEELVELQKERDDFEKETLNMKANVLQLTQEKEQLEQQVNNVGN